MAVGLPLKTTYANGDVYSASDVNDTNGTINANATPYAAGKNEIINGDFFINQRNFTSTTTTNVYGHDRWTGTFTDGTTTYTNQSFTTGAAPVAGYEGKNYARIVTTGQTLTSAFSVFRQRIENVRTNAGQTVTVSFWAQSGTGTPNVAVELTQNFGTGGSPSASVTGIIAATPKQAISTTWTRYSYTISVPSISGKTIGTNEDSYMQCGLIVSAGSDFNARTGSLGIQSNTFNFWGVQLEIGSTATPFQTATGTIQGELAACQRYYQRHTEGMAGGVVQNSTTATRLTVTLPVAMRVAPSITQTSIGIWDGSTATAITSLPTNRSTTTIFSMDAGVASGLTAGRAAMAYNTGSGYWELTSEL
jgi:hypothetical protein